MFEAVPVDRNPELLRRIGGGLSGIRAVVEEYFSAQRMREYSEAGVRLMCYAAPSNVKCTYFD